MTRKKGSSNKKESKVLEYIEKSLGFRLITSETIRCVICSHNMNLNLHQGINYLKRHERSSRHLDNIAILIENKNRATSSLKNAFEIHECIVKAFSSAGMPINALDNEDMRIMFRECFSFELKSGQTYRSLYLPRIVSEKQKKILDSFYNQEFSLYFDETTDANGRYILNVMAKVLNGEKTKCYLISSVQLERTNTKNIVDSLNFILGSLIQSGCKKKFKYLITDGAAYCLSVGRELKLNYTSLNHLVCFCHNLHLLAETIRSLCSSANEFISKLKAATVKNKTNQMIYSESTGLPLPKWPIVTRWGTFIECAYFLFLNYEKIISFVNKLDSSYIRLKELTISRQTREEIEFIVKHNFIIHAIKFLESDGLGIKEQIERIKYVYDQLEDERLKVRLKEILDRNPDFRTIEREVERNNIPLKHEYVNLTTVPVERSFSLLTTLLSDNRRSIKDTNLFLYLFMKMNK